MQGKPIEMTSFLPREGSACLVQIGSLLAFVEVMVCAETLIENPIQPYPKKKFYIFQKLSGFIL